jgi:hypothetical protein
MRLTRRRVIEAGMAAAAGAVLLSSAQVAVSAPRVKAMAFDAFPVFDPRLIAALAEKLYPATARHSPIFGGRASSSTRGCGRSWASTPISCV